MQGRLGPISKYLDELTEARDGTENPTKKFDMLRELTRFINKEIEAPWNDRMHARRGGVVSDGPIDVSKASKGKAPAATVSFADTKAAGSAAPAPVEPVGKAAATAPPAAAEPADDAAPAPEEAALDPAVFVTD